MKVYEFVWKINEYICPKNPRKTRSVKFYDIHKQFNFFGYNFYNDNNNLNRTIRSSFFTAQPAESKNEQNTRNKLKLENKTRIERKLGLTLYELKHMNFPLTF